MLATIQTILGTWQVSLIVALVIGNLVLGVIEALKCGDFRLTRLSDWVLGRMLPIVGGYAVCAYITAVAPTGSDPILLPIQQLATLAFGTAVATLGGFI